MQVGPSNRVITISEASEDADISKSYEDADTPESSEGDICEDTRRAEAIATMAENAYEAAAKLAQDMHQVAWRTRLTARMARKLSDRAVARYETPSPTPPPPPVRTKHPSPTPPRVRTKQTARKAPFKSGDGATG